MKKYEQTDHTADIGLKIFGESLETLFENAGYALCDSLVDLSTVTPDIKETFSIKSASPEELLVEWMGDLLFSFETEQMIYRRFNIKSFDKKSLSAEVEGEVFDSSRHTIRNSIKAVTYHNVRISETNGIWQAEVVLDT